LASLGINMFPINSMLLLRLKKRNIPSSLSLSSLSQKFAIVIKLVTNFFLKNNVSLKIVKVVTRTVAVCWNQTRTKEVFGDKSSEKPVHLMYFTWILMF
jgi:hypothetical protein